MKRLFLVTALSIALPAMAQNVATVNGKAISKSDLDNLAKSFRIEKPTADQRKALIEELVNRNVMLQEAAKQGIEKKPEIKTSIENSREQILLTGLVQSWLEKNPVSEDEVKKAYDDFVKTLADRRQYKVRHILVKDESKAKEILADIKAKKISFSDAAKKYSIDSGAESNAGELSWLTAEDFVPEFGAAVKTAKKGELTNPVKSQFGYHIIEVQDERPITPPTYEQIKGAILRDLNQQKTLEYIASLRKKAKVQINEK